MVLSRAVVRDMVADAQAASMIGYVTMGMSLVPMIGPVIGGILDDAFGWHANFALLLILGVGVLVLVWADLGETATLRRVSLMDQVRTYPGLLTSRRFWGYTLTAIGDAAGNFLAGRFSVRVGMNRMILIGTVVTTLGLLALVTLTVAGLSGPTVFFGLTVFMGLGNGICLPNANAGMLSVRPELAGTASGLGGAILIGGGAALAALAGVLLGPGATEMPLILLMLASSVASVIAILFVIRRARAIGA
jgi:DHA1 family bicyclomycin/chloramphenicol resistance-like MFS transporter